ncbi:nodulation efficiency protein NfeD, partial [Candidatus Poribacteria bacterium]
LIDGRRVDVVAEGEFIERGRRVEVVKVEGNRVVSER